MTDEPEGSLQLDLLSEILPGIISAFRRLDDQGREKLFRTIATIFGLALEPPSKQVPNNQSSPVEPPATTIGRFSKDRDISPKEFLIKKQPHTDVERVACLAYYLTHYRNQPYFKTLDISKLNTEGAQLKFSNAAKAVDNATSYGYLAPATKGNKQISAVGELFVDALPDRDAAKAAMSHGRPKRRARRGNRTKEEE